MPTDFTSIVYSVEGSDWNRVKNGSRTNKLNGSLVKMLAPSNKMAMRSVRTRLENILGSKSGKIAVTAIVAVVFFHQAYVYANFSLNNNVENKQDSLASEALAREAAKDPGLDRYCQCKPVLEVKSNTSVCSDYATGRGRGQKVVSYSYFRISQKNNTSDSDDYLEGISKNYEAIQSYYPGFIMRVYTNVSEITEAKTHSDLCNLFCNNDNLDICDITHLGN